MTVVVGIDPGLDGAYAVLSDSDATFGYGVMPVMGKEIQAGNLITEIEILAAGPPNMVYVEHVHSKPGQGVVSTFTFGKGYGQILGALQASFWPFTLVKPPAWKKVVLKGTLRDKDAAIRRVRSRYPEVNLTPGARSKPHDGIADAFCIAEYGLQQSIPVQKKEHRL